MILPALLRAVLRGYMDETNDGTSGGGGSAPTPAPAPGASADDPGSRTRGPDARLEAMRAIAERNQSRIEADHRAEGVAFNVDAPAPAPTADTPSPSPSPAPTPMPPAPPAPAPAPSASAPAPGPADAPTPAPAPASDQVALQLQLDQVYPAEVLDNVRVRMKVNGVVRELTFAEMRREAQLDGAAGARFQQATQLLQQAQRSSTQAPAPTPAAPAPASSAPAPTPSPPVGSDGKPAPGDSAGLTAVAQRLTKSLFDGNEAETQAALLEVMTLARPSNGAPAPDVQQITATVRQQLSMEGAIAQFTAEYQDIVGDPFLAGIADENFSAIVAADPQKSPAQAMQEAGELTRTWMRSKGLATPTQERAPAGPGRTLARNKSTIDTVVGTSQRATAPAEPAIPSTSQVIENMRVARIGAGAAAKR